MTEREQTPVLENASTEQLQELLRLCNARFPQLPGGSKERNVVIDLRYKILHVLEQRGRR